MSKMPAAFSTTAQINVVYCIRANSSSLWLLLKLFKSQILEHTKNYADDIMK